MSQNAAKTNTTGQTKAGMIAGPHTASQTAQPAYHFGSIDEAKDAPHEYLCPITLQLMRDPVLLVETGQVYDRESIESWFKSGHSSCPTSRTINGVVPTLLDSLACLLESLPSRVGCFRLPHSQCILDWLCHVFSTFGACLPHPVPSQLVFQQFARV